MFKICSAIARTPNQMIADYPKWNMLKIPMLVFYPLAYLLTIHAEHHHAAKI